MKNMKKSFNYIINFVLILSLFEPTLFVKYKYLNIIFIVGACVSLFFAIYKLIKIKKINIITCELIILRILYLANTIINNGDILKVGYQSLIFIALFIYAEIYYRQKRLNVFLSIISKICRIYLLINIVTFVLFPNGLYAYEENIYFLGYRTRFTEYAFLLLMLSIIENYINPNRKKLLFSLSLIILNILLPHISTAIVGLIVTIIFFFLFFYNEKKINFKFLFWIALIVNLLIVIFRIQTLFSFFIENILHKTVSLTYRTVIWDMSYPYIFDTNFLWGHGYPINGNFILWEKIYWQAHNQILQLLYEVGLIGTIIFFHICYMVYNKLEKNYNKQKSKIFITIALVLCAFLIMMITEIYGYYIPFYVVLIIGYFCDGISKRNIEKENKYDRK